MLIFHVAVVEDADSDDSDKEETGDAAKAEGADAETEDGKHSRAEKKARKVCTKFTPPLKLTSLSSSYSSCCVPCC